MADRTSSSLSGAALSGAPPSGMSLGEPVQEPGAVLFACTQNAVRSPMAEAIMKHLIGMRAYVDSCGVRHGDLDPFAVEVLNEVGIDLSHHTPKSFEQMEDGFFDVIVSLSPEAQHRAIELTRTMACDIEYWPTLDVTIFEGSRDTMLDAYRQIRDELTGRIRKRFPALLDAAAEGTAAADGGGDNRGGEEKSP